jgi:NADPH:quinone reductase-like Zn-dependent oxidoreductase
MRIAAITLLVLLAAPLTVRAQAADANTTKAVLVTGASTGIGRKITEHLASKGCFVYAGARKEEDLKALGAIRNVQAIRLDVTRQADIDTAVELALFDASPKRRYMVVPEQREAEVTIRKQIEQLALLNEDQPYTYDREALVRMLDEALARTRPRSK